MKAQAQLRDREPLDIQIEQDEDDSLFTITLDGDGDERRHEVRLLSQAGGRWTLQIGNRIEDVLVHRRKDDILIDWRDRSYSVQVYDLRKRLARQSEALAGAGGVLKSQMPGKVVKVLKQKGDAVEAGEGLVIVEAMKMQNELKSPKSGVVKVCNVVEGQSVEGGVTLYEIE
ncbi:MAG TPA: biotin/lipoyl-containing protein [Acidobacteriota bacterium]|nr:biotin/lipoyl-containing protein [Acidobacteriota bacterium]